MLKRSVYKERVDDTSDDVCPYILTPRPFRLAQVYRRNIPSRNVACCGSQGLRPFGKVSDPFFFYARKTTLTWCTEPRSSSVSRIETSSLIQRELHSFSRISLSTVFFLPFRISVHGGLNPIPCRNYLDLLRHFFNPVPTTTTHGLDFFLPTNSIYQSSPTPALVRFISRLWTLFSSSGPVNGHINISRKETPVPRATK